MIKIIFLGTSSQIPTKNRNHTSILVETNHDSFLIDCGEGTQRQLKKINFNANRISKILITHWHGDHTLGLVGLLETLNFNERKKDLIIYGPKGIKDFILSFLKTFYFKPEFNLKIEEVKGKFFENEEYFLSAKAMIHSAPCNSYFIQEKDKFKIDKTKIKNLPFKEELLKNFKEGKNIKFKNKTYSYKDYTSLEKGKKISFVLDTSFNKKIISFVKNSDILICESTFDKSLKEKAKEYLHLTIDDALNIAKKSNSKRLYLTHISQRYEKDFDILEDYAKKNFKETFLAKDFDEILLK